ncbi:MAG: hypothetical protein P8Y70_09705 [Candidatus Lokiarchaeota archaeon]
MVNTGNFQKIIRNKFKFEIVKIFPILNPKYKIRNIKNVIEGKVPKKYFNFIPKSYDIIGQIAIVEFNNEIDELNINYNLKKEIAKAIVIVNSKVNTVFEKASKVKGKYRRRELRLIYGTEKYETVYRENKCVFKLDVKKTFFTPRLVFERNRISSLKYKEGEIVFDLFAGVGTIAIQIAKSKNVQVYAFDINPYAYSYLLKNLNLNNLKGVTLPFNINVRDLITSDNLREIFHKAKKDSILHSYHFCNKKAPISNALINLEQTLQENNYRVKKVLHSRVVKAYSPTQDLVVIDSLLVSENK